MRALDDKRAKIGGVAEDAPPYDAGVPASQTEGEVRADAVAQLRETIAGMNLDNFVVRQRRRTVEKYLDAAVWTAIDAEARDELVEQVAPLPTAKRHGTEEAKRFDLLMFSLQLALLRSSKRFATLRTQLLEIASALEEQTAIPGIAAQAALIEEIQTDPWWEGVTVPLLELVRLRLRDLSRAHRSMRYNCLRGRQRRALRHGREPAGGRRPHRLERSAEAGVGGCQRDRVAKAPVSDEKRLR
ncbi:hypothetical protein DHODJN_25630 [Methylorubrum extorquens]